MVADPTRVTASRGNSKGWMAAQSKTVTLSTNSVHHVVAGATHASFVEDAGPATAVAQAIHDVVVPARTGAPLNRP